MLDFNVPERLVSGLDAVRVYEVKPGLSILAIDAILSLILQKRKIGRLW